MGVGHCLADRFEDCQETRAILDWGLTGPEKVGESAALDQLHREERAIVGEGSQLVDRHDPWMLELAADSCFFHKSPDEVGLVLVRLEKHLDGELASQIDIAPADHSPHPPARDFSEKEIAIGPIARLGNFRVGRSAIAETAVRDLGLAQGHARERPKRLGDAGQDARSSRLTKKSLPRKARVPFQFAELEFTHALLQQTPRAETEW